MRNKVTIVSSLLMLILVLIGVTIIEPLTKTYAWLMPFTPMIFISGFFIFIVAAILFAYTIISNLNK